MKKQQFKNLKLNKKSISNMNHIVGGEPEISNWKYGYTCWIPDTLQCNPFSITLESCNSCVDC